MVTGVYPLYSEYNTKNWKKLIVAERVQPRYDSEYNTKNWK